MTMKWINIFKQDQEKLIFKLQNLWMLPSFINSDFCKDATKPIFHQFFYRLFSFGEKKILWIICDCEFLY